MNIKTTVDELHRAFDLLNKEFFEGKLPEPAITVQTRGKRLSMGWVTSKPVWADREGKVKKYELNISAEYLNLPLLETIDTMMHEMVHLWNLVHNVKDTSRGGTYHNKNFKTECERRGFEFHMKKPDPKYGWAFPRLTEEAVSRILQLGIDEKAFLLARTDGESALPDGSSGDSDGEGEGKRKSNSYKWICPACGMTVRSSKPKVNLMCGDCKETLICPDADTVDER
jgi:hypothetical protein